jgi:probable F420-dependent oxidoreductase
MELGKIGIWTTELDRLPAVQLRDVLQEIEGVGFRTLWVGESARRREAFTNSALILSSTNHLIVANGVASIWARDASATASAQRVLAEAFPHRFILGLGVSHEGLVSARGHVYEKPIDSMREYLRGIDSHPAGDLPDPPEPPPRVLAALGPGMLELARDHAQGAHPFLVPPEHTHMAREILGPGRILAPEQGVLLEDDPSTAREILRSEMKARLALPNYRKSLVRLGWSDRDFDCNGSDALIDRLFAWGSLSNIAERIDEHLAAGADHVALHVLHGPTSAPPLEEWRELAALV